MGEAKIKDAAAVIHDSGMPFIRYLYEDYIENNLVNDFKKNVGSDYDNLVVIDGGEGSGKSNCAWYIAKTYDPEIVMEECYVYDYDDLSDKVLALAINGDDKGHAFWMDEAVNMASNRAWMKADNQNLINLLMMMRSRGWLLIMCIPHMTSLDVYIREQRYKYHLTCAPAKFENDPKVKERGYVEIQKKDNEGKERACGYGEYPPMTPEEKERYEILKHQAQIRKMQELIDRKNKEKNGAKYKKMYEEQCKSQRNIMYCLSRSGTMDTEGIMQLFGYTDRHQYYNAIVKAKKEAEGEP